MQPVWHSVQHASPRRSKVKTKEPKGLEVTWLRLQTAWQPRMMALVAKTSRSYVVQTPPREARMMESPQAGRIQHPRDVLSGLPSGVVVVVVVVVVVKVVAVAGLAGVGVVLVVLVVVVEVDSGSGSGSGSSSSSRRRRRCSGSRSGNPSRRKSKSKTEREKVATAAAIATAIRMVFRQSLQP